ncbi:MAG: hypothetical protein K2X66_16320 [Cyanobacteria bacterium]|nr:hypothetical protein [Cyanobacteriota bacterium]
MLKLPQINTPQPNVLFGARKKEIKLPQPPVTPGRPSLDQIKKDAVDKFEKQQKAETEAIAVEGTKRYIVVFKPNSEQMAGYANTFQTQIAPLGITAPVVPGTNRTLNVLAKSQDDADQIKKKLIESDIEGLQVLKRGNVEVLYFQVSKLDVKDVSGKDITFSVIINVMGNSPKVKPA